MAVKIDKYTCPFCGKKSIFVGVHDDEGNYKGRPGCEYESDPWSGLCYAIHHDGWGECILCTDAHDLPLGGCFFNTAEEAFQAIPTLTQPKDSTPVQHGRWVKPVPGDGENYCSVCHTDQPWFYGYGYYDSDYCPNCGARMDAKEALRDGMDD